MPCPGGVLPHVCTSLCVDTSGFIKTTYYLHTEAGRSMIFSQITGFWGDGSSAPGGTGAWGSGGGGGGGGTGVQQGPTFPGRWCEDEGYGEWEDDDDDDDDDDDGGGGGGGGVIITRRDDLGWTGGARSVEEIPVGAEMLVTLKIPDPAPGARPTGVAIGLAKPQDVPTSARNGYDHLYCGLVFIGDSVALVFEGEEVDSVPYSDVIEYGRLGEYEWVAMTVTIDTITIYANNKHVYEAARPQSALVLDATLYSNDSIIDDPVFSPYKYGALAGEIPALVIQASHAESSLIGELPPISMLGTQGGDSGALVASVPALTMDALVTRLDPRAKYAKLEGMLPPLLGRFRNTAQKAPGVMTLGAALPGLTFLASDGVGYAELVGNLPFLDGRGLVMKPPVFEVAMETVASRAWQIEQPIVTILIREGVRAGASAEIAAVVTWAHAEETIQACYEHSLVATALSQIIEQAVLGGKVTLRVMLTPDEQAPPGSTPQVADFSQGWAVVEGVQATTRYDNYGFNSFAVINGTQFGMKADGIYLLDGATDGGRPITSGVALGTHDFGTQALKHLPAVYAGVSSAGRLYLKVSDGTNAYTYRARRSDEFMRVQRFDVGKGLRAGYFSFELTGEGDAFELDTVQFMAVPTQRRI